MCLYWCLYWCHFEPLSVRTQSYILQCSSCARLNMSHALRLLKCALTCFLVVSKDLTLSVRTFTESFLPRLRFIVVKCLVYNKRREGKCFPNEFSSSSIKWNRKRCQKSRLKSACVTGPVHSLLHHFSLLFFYDSNAFLTLQGCLTLCQVSYT